MKPQSPSQQNAFFLGKKHPKLLFIIALNSETQHF